MDLKEYGKSQYQANLIITDATISEDEKNRIVKSDLRWSVNRKYTLSRRSVSVGEVYQFDFGKNYSPEMSFEHRGLVIRVNRKMLYVLPICSYDSTKHPNVFHPIDFPESKSDLYLLKSSEFSFLKHDSVLKLNDIRAVSINRIIYSQSGSILPTSDTYKKIIELAFQKTFPEYYHNYVSLQKKCEEQNEIIQDLSKKLGETEE